jgi:hypothetical protein
VVLADLGAVGPGHDHAHQIVRLRIHRGDPHGVAGVMLGLGQRAPVEQRQRERADILRRALKNLDELPLGVRFVAGGKRRPLAAEVGGRLGLGPRRRPVKPTAARIA